jgi:hypothetical protein
LRVNIVLQNVLVCRFAYAEAWTTRKENAYEGMGWNGGIMEALFGHKGAVLSRVSPHGEESDLAI